MRFIKAYLQKKKTVDINLNNDISEKLWVQFQSKTLIIGLTQRHTIKADMQYTCTLRVISKQTIWQVILIPKHFNLGWNITKNQYVALASKGHISNILNEEMLQVQMRKEYLISRILNINSTFKNNITYGV